MWVRMQALPVASSARFHKPPVVICRFLDRLTSLMAWQMNREETSMDTNHDICVISQFCLNVFSSFEHSFFSVKAYTDLHEALLAINNTIL